MADKSTVPPVGAKLWIYDENRREYRYDERGRATGGPIELARWRPIWVIGSNRVSLFLSMWQGDKMGERGLTRTALADWYDGKTPGRFARTHEEAQARSWARENSWRIGDAVRCVSDPVLLAKIAALIGYTDRPESTARPEHLKGVTP